MNMHAIKMLQFIGVAILCLALIEVNMESVSSCDPLDLRTILVHVRQTQSENKQLQDKHNMDIENLHKELNDAENLSRSKLKVIGSKINDSETKNERQLNSLQGQINVSKAEWESQQYLIETLQEKLNVLQIHLNKSETKVSEINSLINISETEVKRQVNRLDDLQLRLNKTNGLVESLMTSLEELYTTFQETNEQLETIQNEFNEETNALSVRLANGTSRSGRLEVSVDGINWGTVCDDGFDSLDARVACRMLGYSGFGVIPNINITDGTGPIFLDDLRCVGTESSLLYCYHREWGTHDCNHSEDVGVSC